MLARIHGEQRDITTKGFQFFTQIAYRDGFSIFKWIRKLFTEEQYLHTTYSREVDHKSSHFPFQQKDSPSEYNAVRPIDSYFANLTPDGKSK